ncbi:MAG: endonuclease [Bacteroidota bacterium]
MQKLPFTIIGLAAAMFISAQTIFPGLTGEELADSLRANFRPQQVLTYGEARDTLWRNIDSEGNTLVGVYSGFSVELDPSLDPTQDAFAKGINAEHTYPRAFGADFGNPEADMHNLFPTRVQVNSDRGNLPFGDINDNQTDDWYFLDQEQSNPPANNRDLYSERLQNSRFEPREEHKGNVARAMFYFYTIYRPEADAVLPSWIDQQLDDLCQWHLDDPVDIRELNRSSAIAFYQDGKENPFVVDCSLARRAYCPNLPQQQCLSSTEDVNLPAEVLIQVIGSNRHANEKILSIEILKPLRLEVDWYDALGRMLSTQQLGYLSEGLLQLKYNERMASGPLVARLRMWHDGRWVMKSTVVR